MRFEFVYRLGVRIGGACGPLPLAQASAASDPPTPSHSRLPPTHPLCSLSTHPQHVTKAALRDRVAAKFVEAEFEKADMLVEVMFRWV